MTPLNILDNLQIATPCEASWDAMSGDERARFCDACSKQVYNVSGLTSDQTIDLIRQHERRLCVRLYRRSDGTVLTADCPVGLRAAIRRRVVRMATAAIVLGLSVRGALAVYCSEPGSSRFRYTPPPTGPGTNFADVADWALHAAGGSAVKHPCPQVMMGGICAPSNLPVVAPTTPDEPAVVEVSPDPA